MRALPAAICLLAAIAVAGCGGSGEVARDGARGRADSPLRALGGTAAAGFARALGPHDFRFPYDHGAHPAYRNEWWYVTGNVIDARGRRYGFQLTLFRIGLAPGHAHRASAWATHQVWMGHLALTDVSRQRFQAHQRFARGGRIGLAGARRNPVEIWLEDWRLARADDGSWRLRASTDGLSLDLALTPHGQPVLQGDRGLSRKSTAPGNASYYYSLPRLSAQGRITLAGRAHTVSGRAWLDREWSTSALGAGQRGWDWFALQLDDGTDVMLYRLRREDGATSPFSAGTVVRPDGRVRHLGADDFTIDVLDRWTSPRGATYPARWRLRVPGIDGTLTVTPVLPDQELDLAVRYWEGAVDIRGARHDGVGYVELTGYADTPGTD